MRDTASTADPMLTVPEPQKRPPVMALFTVAVLACCGTGTLVDLAFQQKAAQPMILKAKQSMVLQSGGKTYMEPLRPHPPDEECIDTKTVIDPKTGRIVKVEDSNCLPIQDARLIAHFALK